MWTMGKFRRETAKAKQVLGHARSYVRKFRCILSKGRGSKSKDAAKSVATFRYVVHNFSELKEIRLSPPCYVRNLPWKIKVMAGVSPMHQKSLGFFLQCDGEAKSSTWSCHAKVELRLIVQKEGEGTQTFSRKTEHLFCRKRNDWGFKEFLAWNDILDPTKGYIKDDTIILEVHVVADIPNGVNQNSKKHSRKQRAISYMKSSSDSALQQSAQKVSNEDDSADLLFNTNYHDCFFTIGNPKNESVENIGVVTSRLAAHSPVFRKWLGFYRQAKVPPSKITITDSVTSPATFKLMLRFVYGGSLPAMTTTEAVKLALCADKYKISRLFNESLKNLNPTSAEDVFPALICVTSSIFPNLEERVAKIIEQKTDKVVQHDDFLKLSEEQVLYIVKRKTLNIGEVEVWKSVVRWAEHQVEANPDRTLRDYLDKILAHVRLLTFTSKELLEHVLPKDGLTPKEFVDLARAVSHKEPLTSSGLCNIQEKRCLYKEEGVIVKVACKISNNYNEKLNGAISFLDSKLSSAKGHFLYSVFT